MANFDEDECIAEKPKRESFRAFCFSSLLRKYGGIFAACAKLKK